MQRKKLTKTVLIVLLFFILSISYSAADSKYTREKSEELFYLIHWHEYTLETFQKALGEQKPVYLVLSAPAWCYWCHVYESVDYLYHPELYPYINENFIAIFIDSDKRPDLTKKYMEGGWPSTTILSPDLRRINGFSGPIDPLKLREYLGHVVAYLEDKSFTEINKEVDYRKMDPVIPQEDHLIEIEQIYLQFLDSAFDEKYGGFNLETSGRKFPAALANKFLLEKYEETGNADYLKMVKSTFDNQFTDIKEFENYRLYDPVEGGFHRYSTKRDWSIPHYEKMLGDQAKLIRTYAHLLKITGDDKVRNAVEGSISFVTTKFHDVEGGFYSSQDAYLEEKYYGLTRGERKKKVPPYVDKTIIMDSNSMMISTFLYLYEIFGNRDHEEIAEQGLDFLRNNMVDKRGAYYYFDHDKRKTDVSGRSSGARR